MIFGDVELWSGTLPDRFIPDVLRLICDTWEGLTKPAAHEHEVPITRRFRLALRRAKDFRCLPLRVEREVVEDDVDTGDEIGRKDLVFVPVSRAREDVYLCFECKRLNALMGAETRPLGGEYVSKGMMRFVTGQYSSAVTDGGMIGYVLDGRLKAAIENVRSNIKRNRDELRLTKPPELKASGVLTGVNNARETEHDLGGLMTLHHLFLSCPRSERLSSDTASQTR